MAISYACFSGALFFGALFTGGGTDAATGSFVPHHGLPWPWWERWRWLAGSGICGRQCADQSGL